MFESFCEELKSNPPRKGIVYEGLSLFDNPTVNANLLREKIYHIDKLSDRDLYNLVKESFDSALKQIFTDNCNSQEYLNIITNARFLTTLNQVVLSLELTHSQKIYCNKLAYDYFTLENTDSYIKQLFFSLSKSVNRGIIATLCAIGLREDLASYIALARYSSEKEIVNVKRLNFVLVCADEEVMTDQMIIKIYEKLFDHVTALFEGIMFDDELDYDAEYVTDSMSMIYSTISLAILEILNNMPAGDIRKVLIAYHGDYEALFKTDKPRFRLTAISTDYQRILDVIENLKNEGIFIY